MGLQLLRRVARGVLWRVLWHQETLILRATALGTEPPNPRDCALVCVRSGDSQDPAIAEVAMAAAGEDAGAVRARFGHGDVFFGWLSGGTVVSFAWATYRDRSVAGTRLLEAAGRVFLYNAQTLPPFRGRGLYPSLALQMQRVLTNEGAADFVIDVDARNVASRQGIAKARFVLAATATSLVLFRRWTVNLTRTMVDGERSRLF